MPSSPFYGPDATRPNPPTWKGAIATLEATLAGSFLTEDERTEGLHALECIAMIFDASQHRIPGHTPNLP